MSAKRQKTDAAAAAAAEESDPLSETGSAANLGALNATFAVDGCVFVEDPEGPSAKAVLTCGAYHTVPHHPTPRARTKVGIHV